MVEYEADLVLLLLFLNLDLAHPLMHFVHDHLVSLQLLKLSYAFLVLHDQRHVLLCLKPCLFSLTVSQLSFSCGLLKLPVFLAKDSLRNLIIFLLCQKLESLIVLIQFLL